MALEQAMHSLIVRPTLCVSELHVLVNIKWLMDVYQFRNLRPRLHLCIHVRVTNAVVFCYISNQY